MPLIQPPPTVALPYIDTTPSIEALSAANALVQAELPADNTSVLHPSLPPMRESKLSDLVEQEYARIGSGAAKEPGAGIDLTRYGVPDAPAHGSDKAAWSAALREAYTSLEYLRGREINLSLLETYGKNAWLVGNSALEDELTALEREVEAAKVELEATEQARRAVQSNAAGEIQGLDEGWRNGVGRMIEAQAAAERLKGEILKRRRAGAV